MQSWPWIIRRGVLAGVMALAACGGDQAPEDRGHEPKRGSETTPPARGQSPTLDVSLTEFKIEPTNLKVARPGTVHLRVRNRGKVIHALAVARAPGRARGKRDVWTGRLRPGKVASFQLELARPGRYTWYCPVGDHYIEGMGGAITVGGG
jgi:uncharacterized cupredoxin-like copper-binding protein